MEIRKLFTLMAVLLPVVCFAGPKEVRTVTFKTQLHCENCVKKVMENISFVKGVKDLEVSLEKQEITVKYDASRTDAGKLGAEIQKLGYPAEEMTAMKNAVKFVPTEKKFKASKSVE